MVYNNSGYVLLGAVLEKVTGKSWDQAVNDLVTGPLKLATIRSGIGADGTRGMAKGYTDRDDKVAPSMAIHMSVPHAAGALVGTVGDMAAWADALHNGKVVTPASYAAMTTPAKKTDGSTAPYGFGLQLADVRDRKAVGHGGGIFGFSTDSIYLPNEKIFVAVFANSDSPKTDPEGVTMKLAALAVGDPFPEFKQAAVDVGALKPAFGVYAFPDAERTFFTRDGKLYAQRAGRPELEVLHAGGNKFFYAPEGPTWFQLVKDAAGKPQLAFHQEGSNKAVMGSWKSPPPAEVPAFAVPAATLDSYVGSYIATIGTFLIGRDGNGLTVKLNQQPCCRRRQSA